MALVDIKVPTEDVAVPGGSLTVRGLSLNDLTVLLSGFRTELERIFAHMEKMGSVSMEGMAEIADTLLLKSPTLVAHAILLAADEEITSEAVKQALKLSIGVQTDAIEKIGRLTFEGSGGVKKFLGTLVKISKGVAATVGELEAPGSGVSLS